MKIQIHCHEFEKTQAIEDHISDALESLRKFADPTNIHVYLETNAKGDRNSAKIDFHSNKKDYSAKEDSENLYKSIDLVVHKLEKQLRRDHSKTVTQRKHSGSIKDLPVQDLESSEA